MRFVVAVAILLGSVAFALVSRCVKKALMPPKSSSRRVLHVAGRDDVGWIRVFSWQVIELRVGAVWGPGWDLMFVVHSAGTKTKS